MSQRLDGPSDDTMKTKYSVRRTCYACQKKTFDWKKVQSIDRAKAMDISLGLGDRIEQSIRVSHFEPEREREKRGREILEWARCK